MLFQIPSLKPFLKWSTLKVLRFETTGPNEEVFHLISEAIGRAGCASLEELEIHFQSPNTAIEQRFEKDKVSRDLKTFSLFYDYLPSLRKYIIKSNNHYDSGVFLQMLLNTPNLTYMDVTSGLSSAFFSGCWPNLQHLRFVSCPTGKDYLPRVQTFFRRHSKLITLSTHNILLPGWATESDDFLPNLKSLYVSLELHPHTITANIAARLAHLEMNPGLYSYLAECGIVLSNLETCVYFNAHLEESIQKLVVMTPNIQKLHISFDQRLTLDEIMERVSHFAGFKNLRVLIRPLDEVSVDTHLPFRVLYDFPRLLYTRMNLINQGRKIFRLERDDIAKVMNFLQMLVNMHNLTHINVGSGLSSALFSGYWPNLQHFKFSNYMNCPTGKDYLPRVRTFLHRHSKLIVLSTYNILLPGWAIESDDFLPSLKSFYISLELDPHTITTNVAARLTHLEMNNDLYSYLTKHGIILSNLETCLYLGAHLEKSIQKLVAMAPNIQKLCIILEPVLCSFDSESDAEFVSLRPDHEVMEHLSHFAGFKNLRVLIGPFDDTLIDSHLLSKVLYNFPRLLYTRVRVEDDGIEFFRLERDDIAKVVRYKHQKVRPDECNTPSWDSIYRQGH